MIEKMTKEEAVGFYHSLNRFGINPGLERIKALCSVLGNPQDALQYVHVAGTNGKGSTCTEMASVLQNAGYRVGLYTSPYIIDFGERIQLNGQMIPADDLIRVTEKIAAATEALNKKGVYPTEFEAVTAAAFLYYAEEKCDIVVLETGLGGRFDATNIIKHPLVSVIVSVSLDHVRILGNTLSEIAFEKSGIIKPGCPVVTSCHQPAEVRDVIKNACRERNCAYTEADDTMLFTVIHEDITGTKVRYENTEFTIPFPGAHQTENTSLVIKATECLKRQGYNIPDNALQTGIGNARIPARTELLSVNPLIMLDGSHNEGSTLALAELLKKYMPGKRVLAVMGMMADKDTKTVLKNLLPAFSYVIAVTPSNPRAMESTAFLQLVNSFDTPGEAIENPVEGVEKAIAILPGFDALIVCGSLYLASDVRETLIGLVKHYK